MERLDQSVIRTQLPVLVSAYLSSNCRKFNCSIWNDLPNSSNMGLTFDPKPIQGTVINKTDDMIIIKPERSRNQFVVLNRQLVTLDPDEGEKVRVTPYARRHVDGKRLDEPQKEIRHQSDGIAYMVESFIIGSVQTHLPLPEPRCPELAEMIRQLESLYAPDGFRRITHLLLDANAHNFTCVDPSDKDIIKTPLAIRFSVASEKFCGEVAILYKRGDDLYAIELYQDGKVVEQMDGTFFDTLDDCLEHLIDDGQWRRIQVEVLSPAKSKPIKH